jgi:hypothetical protein
MVMIRSEEFQGNEFYIFKKDVERIIKNLDTGEYTTELNDVDDPLEIINKVSKNDPEEYLSQCRFFRFFSEIYKLPYVEKIVKYAEQNGYALIGPGEFKDEYSMEHFVKHVLSKKQKGAFDIDSCFKLVFIKKTENGQHSLSDIRTVRLLEYNDSRYTVRKSSELLKEIKRIGQ